MEIKILAPLLRDSKDVLSFRLTFGLKMSEIATVRKAQEGSGKGEFLRSPGVPDMSMIRTGVKSEPERYYLFAGMGGRASRRKQKIIFQWSLLAGVLVSAIVAGVLYLISK